MNPNNISPEQFLRIYKNGEQLKEFVVLDVREPAEWEYYHLEGSKLMPMNSIPGRLGELPKDRTVYVICAHGIRSVMACQYLERNGFRNLRNVEGGMAAVAELRGFQYD